jgi:hypothetical protein
VPSWPTTATNQNSRSLSPDRYSIRSHGLWLEDVEKCLEQQGSLHRQDRRSLWARARVFMEPAWAPRHPRKGGQVPNRSMTASQSDANREGVQDLVAVGNWLVQNRQAKPVPIRARR